MLIGKKNFKSYIVEFFSFALVMLQGKLMNHTGPKDRHTKLVFKEHHVEKELSVRLWTRKQKWLLYLSLSKLSMTVSDTWLNGLASPTALSLGLRLARECNSVKERKRE